MNFWFPFLCININDTLIASPLPFLFDDRSLDGQKQNQTPENTQA